MIDALQFDFMQHAVLAGILTSIACGVIGSIVVVNRIVFVGGGIAHAAYGGIGLAFFLGISPLLGAMGFALAVSVIIAAITLKKKERIDTIIGVIWAAGMALGVILIDITPGYNVDLMSYLFGSILTVPYSDLVLMTVLDVIILGVIFFYYRDILALSHDEDFALTVGVPTQVLYFVLLALIALTTVVIIRVVGLILVIALLAVPPYIAEHRSSSLAKMMLISTGLSLFFVLSGLYLSYRFNLTSGAAIIAVSIVIFALDFLTGRFKRKRINVS